MTDKESLIEYPCDFPIKVMGKIQDGLLPAIVHVCKQFDPQFDEAKVEQRLSKGGNYLGLTVTVRVTSREQLDELYRTLSTHPMVSVVLQVSKPALEVIDLGIAPYDLVYEKMREYTRTRDENTPDQFWLVEHPPVFTLGQAGDPSHLIDQNTDIPVVKVDRGGQITYHGPGQVVVYLMLDLKRNGYFVRDLVNRMEQAIIDTLADFDVDGQRQAGAPGIYLGPEGLKDPRLVGAKIAALGLKVSRHCCYHGLALNVDMDLVPFEAINPCGYAGLNTIELASLGILTSKQVVASKLVNHLKQSLKLAQSIKQAEYINYVREK